MDTLLEEFKGAAPADKGFIDARRQAFMPDRHEILVVTTPRKNMKTTPPEPLLKFCRHIRKRIETAGPHLTGRFKAGQIRAHAVRVFLNLTFNRAPLDLDGLVTP